MTTLPIYHGRNRLHQSRTNAPVGTRWQQVMPASKWGISVLACAALAVSVYLARSGLTSSNVAGCGGGVFDCGHVMNTKWSSWLGIPVGVLASGLYSMLVTAVAVSEVGHSARVRNFANAAVVTLGYSASVAAVWFIGLQVFQIGHLCVWCLAAHLCGLGIAAILIYTRPLGSRLPGMPTIIATTGVSLLIMGQVLAKPPQTYEVQHFDDPAANVPADDQDSSTDSPDNATEPILFEAPVFQAPVFEAPAADAPLNDTFTESLQLPIRTMNESAGDAVSKTDAMVEKARVFSLAVVLEMWTLMPSALGSLVYTDETVPPKSATQETQNPERAFVSLAGGVRLKRTDWPLLGTPDAKYVFVEMFDYTCPHCRNTHLTAIRDLKKRYGHDLAIIALPVPLNSNCNVAIRTTDPHHANACELAELSIAVWRVDPEKFSEFHDWLFESTQSRSVPAARQHAAALVDNEQLSQVLSGQVCRQYIDKNVQLYQKVGAGAVPKMLFATRALVGEIDSAEAIASILEEQFGAL